MSSQLRARAQDWWAWFGRPVTARELEEETDRLADIANAMSDRGLHRSGERERRQDDLRRGLLARRRRYRLLAVVLLIITVAALADPFTTNRLVTAIKGAAIALTAPLALYFAVRTDQMTR